MDSAPIPLAPAREGSFDPLERDRIEVDAAISLVLEGMAARVRLANLSRPEAAAAHAAAEAGGTGIRVCLVGNGDEPRALLIERAPAA